MSIFSVKSFWRPGFVVSLSSCTKKAVMHCATLLCLLTFTGCRTPHFEGLVDETQIKPESIVLHEGDVVNIKFPGAPTMDVSQQIQRDGRLRLQLIGEIYAARVT